MTKRWLGAGVAVVACLSWPHPARAVTVTLTGSIFDSCLLTVATPGTLGAESSGTAISSEGTGGVAAIVSLISIGSTPSINFAAPTLSFSPVGYARTPVVNIRYTSIRGGSQAYTASATSFTPSALLDTITINARATDALGFPSGLYTISTVVTCQQ